jgi:alpha-beta hydrolase superfamily lysophospholipase
VFLHGIISHGGWYEASCRSLASAGLEVHFLERRGSGLNAAARGDVDRYTTWLADVESYLERLTPPLPVFLLGISWGGKLAAAVARHRPDLLAGFGMLCPGPYARQQAGMLSRLALRLAGRLGLQGRSVTIPLQDPALFTDSPSWQEFIRTDSLTLRKVTIRFALNDLELNRYATEAPDAIRVPALLMLAGRDRIIDNRRTRDFFHRFGSPDKTLLEYPDAGHTLEFEPTAPRYAADLVQWAYRVTANQRLPC